MTVFQLKHWDQDIRKLTSETLYILTPYCPEHMVRNVMPDLQKKATSLDVSESHGAILAIGEVVHSLSRNGDHVVDDIVPFVQNLLQRLQDRNMLRGVRGEMMAAAICMLIEKLCLSRVSIDETVHYWLEFLENCLRHHEEPIRAAAVAALPVFCVEYYKGRLREQQEELVGRFVREVVDTSWEHVRCGFALAIGALPGVLLTTSLQSVVYSLVKCMYPSDKDAKWTSARRDCVRAMASIVTTVGVDKGGDPRTTITEDTFLEVSDSLMAAASDYTTDSRGDIGACVREAAMDILRDVILYALSCDPSILSPAVVEPCVMHMCEQFAQKIDRTRAVAGRCLSVLVHQDHPPVPNIPDHELLKGIIPEPHDVTMKWQSETEVYQVVGKLLALSRYRVSVLSGLVISVGGVFESVRKHSSAALFSHVQSLRGDVEQLCLLVTLLLDIFDKHKKDKRVTVPLMNTFDQLLNTGYLTPLQNKTELFVQLVQLCRDEIIRSLDYHKLTSVADLCCSLLQFPGECMQESLKLLTVLLGHKYGGVRKSAAEKMYESLLMFDDIVPGDNLDDVMTLISETEWGSTMEEARRKRDTLCKLLGVQPPRLMKTTT